MIEILILIGVIITVFVVFSIVTVIAIAWIHHPEGIIKAMKNRRRK